MKTNWKKIRKQFSGTHCVLIGLLLLAWQPAANAHATVDHAEPAVGSKVKKPPTEVKVWFTDDLDPAASSIEIRNAQDKEVDKKDAHVDAKKKSLLTVSVPKLPPGVYTVNWHVVCDSGHRTQGHFEFTIEK